MSIFQKIKLKYEKFNVRDFINEVKWMYAYAKVYRMAIVFYCVMGIVGTLMGLAGSVMTKVLIDVVTGYKTSDIGLIAAAMIGMAAGNIIINAVTGRMSAKISIRVQNEIQADIYNKIIDTDWESLYDYRSGDLLNRLNGDVSNVSGCVIGWVPSLLAKLVQFFGTLAVILYYDPTMALIALTSAPVSFFISRYLLGKMSEYNKKMREAGSDLMAFQEDSFQNIQSIKSFGITGHFQNEMKKLQDNYQTISLEFNRITVTTTAFMSLMGTFISYACLGWAVYRLWSGAIIFGTMTMFLQLASGLTVSFSALIGLVPKAIMAATCAGRIMEVAMLPAEKDEEPEIAGKVVSRGREKGLEVYIKNLSFSYRNGRQVLGEVSMNVKPGSVAAIVGPSGEGKTTLIRILLGLVNPTSGSACIMDDKGNECRISVSTRRAFSYVPQGNTIFAGTIEENLRMVRNDATDEEIVDALKTACAWDFVKKMPDGIKSKIKERGTGLSEGQAQRISIARAILKDAPIILFDEATSALDVETEMRVLNNILNGRNQKTCIVTTHRPSVLEMCSDAWRIENGRMIKIQ